MRNKNLTLQHFIVPSIPFASLLIGMSFLFWVFAYFSNQIFSLQSTTDINGTLMEQVFIPNTLVSSIFSFIFSILNAVLLSQINTKFTLIRTRTFLPFFIFLLIMGTWDVTHVLNGSNFGLTLFALSLFLFFEMSRNLNAVEQSFMGSLLIGVSSLIIFPFVFLIPICWIGFVMFQSFSLRTFLASLIGILNPWILYLAFRYYLNSDFDIVQYFSAFFAFKLAIPVFSLPIMIYIGMLILILFLVLIGLYSNLNYDAIQTRNRINFLVLVLFTFSALSLIFNAYIITFLPLIAFTFSLIASHPFSLKKGIFYPIVFYVFCVLNIAFLIYTHVFV